MSTQNGAGIDFSIIPEDNRQHFRLLELPPDLLNLVAANDASPMYLKSSDNADGPAAINNIVLCTYDKTYNVRQVSTSNSLFVAQSSRQNNESRPQPGVEVIAQCSSTLEVSIASNVSAVPLLSAALPTYTSTGHHGLGNSRSKREFFENFPLSDGECERGWMDLACFELDGVALLPSDSVRLKVWQTLLTSATARGLDLTKPLSLQDREKMVEDDSEWPVELSNAVLTSMSTAPSSSTELQLDETKIARTVGLCLLKERTHDGRRSAPTNTFQTSWADLMPEKWRTKADMSLLDGHFKRENSGAEIALVKNGVDQAGASSAAPADAKTASGAKRKWHEKFRAAKKTA